MCRAAFILFFIVFFALPFFSGYTSHGLLVLGLGLLAWILDLRWEKRLANKSKEDPR